MKKSEKEKNESLTALHLGSVDLSKDDRKSLLAWFRVLDQIEKKIPLEKIIVPFNNPFIAKGFLAKSPPDIEKLDVNWLMPSSDKDGESFLAWNVFLSEHLKKILPKASEKTAEKYQKSLLVKLLEGGKLSPLDKAPTKAFPGQKEASVLALSVLSDAISAPVIFKKVPDISDDTRHEVITSALLSSNYGLAEGYTCFSVFKNTKDVIKECLEGLSLQNEKDPQRIQNALQVAGLIRQHENLQQRENPDHNPAAIFTNFLSEMSKLDEETLAKSLIPEMFSKYSSKNILLDLVNNFFSESQNAVVVNKWAEAFDATKERDYSAFSQADYPLALFPLSNPKIPLSDEQAIKWIDNLGKLSGLTVPTNYTRTDLFGNRYLSQAADQIKTATCFSEKTNEYMQEIFEAVQGYKKEIDDKKAESYYYKKKFAPSEDSVNAAEAALQKRTLTLARLFSGASLEAHLKNENHQPKQKRL